MEISDRGTKGLGGPTRADIAVAHDHDFISFVRNIGEPRDVEFGGGTYGFGKGVFYLISQPGTILLHSRCKVRGRHETRLIGCALWQSFVANEAGRRVRYTGRHWWGDTSRDVIEPLVDHDADRVVRLLGLTPFGSDETGTSVVVLDPHFEGREPKELARYLADAIAWHLWPKMLAGDSGEPSMRFSVTCDGIRFPVPDPRELRPLNMFVKAYDVMRSGRGKILECRNPKQVLGRIGMQKEIAMPLEPSAAAEMVGIDSVVHHVCLLRSPELVVTYHPGPKPPSEHIAYAGVFRADPSVDDVYARAEPPTHDAWHHQSLESRKKTFVRTTFRRITEEAQTLLDLGGSARVGVAHVPLGAASAAFSSLVGDTWGIGGATDYRTLGDIHSATDRHSELAAGLQNSNESYRADGSPVLASNLDDSIQQQGPPGRDGTADRFGMAADRPTGRRLRVEYIGDPSFEEREGTTVLVQAFRLPAPGLHVVRAELAVMLRGAVRETDPPLEAEMPELVGWEDAAGLLYVTSTQLIEGGTGELWRALVRPAPDTVTDIDIVTQAVAR